jgi:hypothetical protein
MMDSSAVGQLIHLPRDRQGSDTGGRVGDVMLDNTLGSLWQPGTFSGGADRAFCHRVEKSLVSIAL